MNLSCDPVVFESLSSWDERTVDMNLDEVKFLPDSDRQLEVTGKVRYILLGS